MSRKSVRGELSLFSSSLTVSEAYPNLSMFLRMKSCCAITYGAKEAGRELYMYPNVDSHKSHFVTTGGVQI